MIKRAPCSTLFPYTTLFRSKMFLLGALPVVVILGMRYDIVGLCGVIALNVLLVLLADENTDRKSTRLNSSHANISYAVFCLKKKRRHYSKTVCHHLTNV